jgi:hypothetical protein
MFAEISENINGFTFEFRDINLTAKASRLRVTSDGQVKGELSICHKDANGERLLLVPTQFNFSAELTRARYSNQLKDKLDSKIEWREIFDYLSQKVQELVRGGDNYIEVYPDENTPAPEQLLEGIIYRGVQNIIFGEKGVSKSTLAYLLGMCVTLPWDDNPLELDVPERSIRTLVLDWETDERVFRYYVSRLQKGMAIPLCSLFYRRCTLPLMDDIEPIQRHIGETGAELLIIDSLGAAAGGERGELKGSESALLFNAGLRKLKRTSLILAQTRKGEEDKRKTIYGSTYFTYYARNIFELCQGHEDYGDVAHLALFHRECNLGRKMPPIGLRIEFNEVTGGINIEREAVSVAEFSEKVSTSMRILEVLKNGSMNQKDLKEQLDVSYATLGMALKRLAKQKKVYKIGKEWGLATQEGF